MCWILRSCRKRFVPIFLAISAIDFRSKEPYSDAMWRTLLAGAVVVLAVGLTLVGYNLIIVGTGMAGAFGVIYRYWQDLISEPSTTEKLQWMIILGAALVVAWRTSRFRDAS